MRSWTEYKNHVKSLDSDSTRMIDEIEEQASIISAIVKARMDQGMSQRELANACSMPQSSVARIESFQTSPNLSTLLKIMQPLGLKIIVSK